MTEEPWRVSVSSTKKLMDKQRPNVLSRERNLVTKGWQEVNQDSLCPYIQRKNELSNEYGCALLDYRVVIPLVRRKRYWKNLMQGYQG